MCKLYIETSDLDKAAVAADKKLPAAGFAVLDLESEELNKFVERRLGGINFVSPLQHTKFSFVTGIVIGLELARTGLTLLIPDQYDDDVA